jgi:hypothetical protein
MRDKIEELLAIENADFKQVLNLIESEWKFIFDGIGKVERSLNANSFDLSLFLSSQ